MLALHLESFPFLLHLFSANNLILCKVSATAENCRQWLSWKSKLDIHHWKVRGPQGLEAVSKKGLSKE